VNTDGVLDWMIGFIAPYTPNSGLQAVQRYRWRTRITVHRYTRTRVLSLLQSYPGNGIITVPPSLQITYEVFLSQSKSFLAIACQSPSTSISRTRSNSWQQLTHMNSPSTELSQLLTTTNCSLETSLYIALGRTPRKTPSSIVPYCCTSTKIGYTSQEQHKPSARASVGTGARR
jgi:hypothetical protein